ncbi:MAG: energy transducer TonB [Robiginitomaculum sp.]
MEEDNIEIKDGADQHPKQYKIIWLWLLLLAIVFAYAVLIIKNPKAVRNTPALSQETARSAYQLILEETRTGIRLARLEDYLVQFPKTVNIAASRAQRDALKTNEEAAWSKLTGIYYDLDVDETDKSLALKSYIKNWSQLSREEQLTTLTQNAPTQDNPDRRLVKESTRFSTKRPGDKALAGGLGSHTQKRSNRIITHAPIRPVSQIFIVNAKIKYSRKPKYPRKAQRRRISGTVALAFTVGKDGHVSDIRVVFVQAAKYKSQFIKAARRAALRSRFHPKTIGGKPVPTYSYTRTYRFTP